MKLSQLVSKKFWTEGNGSLLVAVLIALTIRWAFMEAYVIPSGSMLPSLLIRDHIFVNKFVYGIRIPFTENWLWKRNEPKRGEVIVFKYPEEKNLFYIKRVVGVPGDKVYYENGDLYVNDKLVEKRIPQALGDEFAWLRDADFPHEGIGATQNYLHWEESLDGTLHSILLRKRGRIQTSFEPWVVPPDSYFVMGDNRDNSADSRLWKTTHFVPRENLLGRAMFVWLSCEESLPIISFLCDPRSVRWTRFFHVIN